jgi:hypothetical protein
MKLYTTDQVIDIFEKYGNMSAINARNIIDLSESIELPSDEEIDKQAEYEDNYSKKCAFTRGAKWMGRKTFGGKNEQQ